MSHTVNKCLFSTESTSKQKSDFHKQNMEKKTHIGIYTPVSTITDIANQAIGVWTKGLRFGACNSKTLNIIVILCQTHPLGKTW